MSATCRSIFRRPKALKSRAKSECACRAKPKGHRYDADGYLRPNPEKLRLEWGADEGYYSGWLQVEGQNGNGHDSAQVTVHLSFKEKPGQDSGHAPSDADIQEGMQKALQSIQNYVEGTGGKEEPAAAT
jgi:hypothetical protein